MSTNAHTAVENRLTVNPYPHASDVVAKGGIVDGGEGFHVELEGERQFVHFAGNGFRPEWIIETLECDIDIGPLRGSSHCARTEQDGARDFRMVAKDPANELQMSRVES